MVSKSAKLISSERVRPTRILWVGLVTLLAVTAVNCGLDLITVALFRVPFEFEPLQFWAVVVTSVIVVVGATGVFAVTGRFSRRPLSLFTRIAWAFLFISLLPLVPLFLIEPAYYPGTNLQTIATLVVMHGVSAGLTIGLLTTLAGERSYLR